MKNILGWTSGGGDLGDSDPMDDVSKINAAIKALPAMFRDPMRKLRTLLQVTGVPLDAVAQMSVDELAGELATKVTSRGGGLVTNPRLKARAILRHLRSVSCKMAELQLPCPPPLPSRPNLPEMAEHELPQTYLEAEATWRTLNDQVRGREDTGLTAIKRRTFRRYVKRLRQILWIAKNEELIAGEFSIRDLVNRDVVDAILETLDAKLSRWTVASFVAALMRAARDLYSEDETHRSDIEHLGLELAQRIPNPELTAEELLELDNLAENNLFAAALETAPSAIVERSREPGLRPLDRLARLSAACAVAIKFKFPILAVSYLAALDTARNLRSSEDGYELQIPDPAAPDGYRWDRCSPRITATLREWDTLRRLLGVDSTYLFAIRANTRNIRKNKEQLHQNAAIVGALVMSEMEAVMGLRLGFRKMKTTITHVAVVSHPTRTAAIAQAVGLQQSYLEQRWRAVLQRDTKQ